MRRVSTAPTVIAVALAYAVFTLLGLALHGATPLWFVWIGERWAEGVIGGRTGYDGQFVLYIARDGWAAVPHLDAPGYRFGRILLPLLARGLSGGNGAALPWAMLAINYAAAVAGTAALAGWLARRDTAPAWALTYGLSLGLVFAYSRDTTEPLAYGLAAAGLVAWLEDRRAAGALLLALAGLTRETTLLCIAGLAAPALLRRRWSAAAVLVLAALPTIGWQLYLAAVLPVPAARLALHFIRLPLAGALPLVDWEPGRVGGVLFCALPALALAPGAFAWVARRPLLPVAWLVALHVLLVLTLSSQSYSHWLGVARIGLGLVVALVLAFPLLSTRLRTAVAAFCVAPLLLWAPVMLGWAPWTAVR
ncbi:MAG: hypothetical protein SF182_20950 [Deltaproteobacteria bacterium]|nr:hypothetical protein [Deltaproteobacteria bacterium]